MGEALDLRFTKRRKKRGDVWQRNIICWSIESAIWDTGGLTVMFEMRHTSELQQLLEAVILGAKFIEFGVRILSVTVTCSL